MNCIDCAGRSEARCVLSRWMAAAGVVVGRGHAEGGLPCQDVAEAQLTDDVAAIVVSDGAGSATHSAKGAAIAVKTTIAILREMLPWSDREAVGDAVLAGCRSEMAKQATAKGYEVGELAATLAFVAVSSSVFIAGSLGDGVVMAAKRRGFGLEVPESLFEQDRGEYANETVFLTSSHARQRLRIVRESLDADGFLVMSDGSAESLFLRNSGTPAPAVHRILSAFEDRPSYDVDRDLRASVMPMLAERTKDDCSLAVLRRVRFGAGELKGMSRRYQEEVLGCRSTSGLENRFRVWECLREGIDSVAEICDATCLSETTVRRHKRALGLLTVGSR